MSLEQESAQQKPLIKTMDKMTEFGPSLSSVLSYVLDMFREGKTNEEIETDMQTLIEQRRKEYLTKYQ